MVGIVDSRRWKRFALRLNRDPYLVNANGFYSSASPTFDFRVSIRSRCRKTSDESKSTSPFELRPNSDEFRRIRLPTLKSNLDEALV